MFRSIDHGGRGISTINRCVLTVKARQPLLDWLLSLPDPPSGMTLAKVNQDTTVYLLPDYESDDDKESLLDIYHDLVFEEQLMGWWTLRSDWPSVRDRRTFEKWFEVEFHSLALDLVDAPLSWEE